MRRRLARLVLIVAALAAAAAAVGRPAHREAFAAAAFALVLLLGLGELFTLGLERFVGFRYLHRARKPRGTRGALVVSLVFVALGFTIFLLARGHSRAGETLG